MWILFAFGSAFFAGITAILAKVGIRRTDSNVATALRTIVVLLFSWVMVFLVGSQRTLFSISGRTLAFLCLSGLATGASWLCYFRALQLGDINRVTPVDKSSTVLTMLLALILLREPLNVPKVLGIVLIAAGTWLMVVRKKGGSEESAPKSRLWLLYAALSAVFASLQAILGKIGIEGVESNLGTAVRTCVVLVMAWVVVFVTRKQHTIREIDGRSWVFLVLSGVSTGASWLCYYRALQTGQASVVVPIDKLSIVLTVVFAWFFFGEKLTKKAWLGLGLIVAGTLAMLIPV